MTVRVWAWITLLALVALPAMGLPGAAGPYRVDLVTQPEVVPVGKAQVDLAITDTSGKPVEGAVVRVLVKMPTMSMGEKETTARAGGKPGHYTTEALFMMAGAYEATLAITSPTGAATVRIPLQTGQSTGAPAGVDWKPIAGGALLLVLVAFTLVRMRRTGQSTSLRGHLSFGVVSSVLLLVAMLAVVVYAVNRWRRAGAMTPIEAQAMEMNTPAPPGSAPVMLATAESGPVTATARYTGQVAGFNEQEIIARTAGRLLFMPLYAGDTVHKGQVLARLDTSQVEPEIAQQRAAVSMANREVAAVGAEYRQSQAEVSRMQADMAAKQDALAASKSEVEAARAEQASAESELAAMESMVVDARAMQDAAAATSAFKQAALKRTRALAARGAVSTEELQRDEADAAEADASLRRAAAQLGQAEARVRGGQSAVKRAVAMSAAAALKQRQMASEARAAGEAVRSAQAMSGASRSKIGVARAGVDMARGGLAAADTRRGYAVLTSPMDGVVTQRLLAPGVFVSAGQAILRVAQVRPVRLQANVAEADLAAIAVGTPVTATGPAITGSPAARVTSVSPLVDPVSRTAVVEAVVPNADGRLLPGQYVVLEIRVGNARTGVRVPSAAVLVRPAPTGDPVTTRVRHYVWVAAPAGPGEYTVSQVEVQVGASDRLSTAITSGIDAGVMVVTAGYQSLKQGDTVTDAGAADRSAAAPALSEATVKVSSAGYTPASVSLRAGVPARLTFIRVDEQNCGNEVVLPAYGIRRSLPLNQPVVITFTPRAGVIRFTCGMNMLQGKVQAQ